MRDTFDEVEKRRRESYSRRICLFSLILDIDFDEAELTVFGQG